MFESVDAVVRKTVEINNFLAELSDSGYSLNGCTMKGFISWEGIADNDIIAVLKKRVPANDIVDDEWKVLLYDENHIPCAIKNGNNVWLLWCDFDLVSSLTMSTIRELFVMGTSN